MKVFVSYAREDTEFRNEVVAALAEQGVDSWVDEDVESIPPAAKWMGEIHHGIENTDALVAVVSPDSARSDVCGDEVRHADQLGKPIVPIVRRDVEEPDEPIPEIAARNWIFWRSDEERTTALTGIDIALTIDTEWAKQHQSLLNDALDWERHDRDRHRVPAAMR
ncbi:MAG: toll/interleukin-1 receptor domain-containing protein [Actinomycetota bacterium]